MVGGQGFVETIPVTLLRLLNIVIADIYGEGKHTRSGLELSADVAAGDSGGPIINAKGQVIGLVFSRSTQQSEISYGISSTEFPAVTQGYDLSGFQLENAEIKVIFIRNDTGTYFMQNYR